MERRPDTIAEIDAALKDACAEPLADPLDQEQWISHLLERRWKASQAEADTGC